MNTANLLFYDIECFKYDSLVVFASVDKDLNVTGLKKWWNEDFDKIPDYIKDRVLVGYNNHYYDDVMLTKIIRGASLLGAESLQTGLKATNDKLIAGQYAYPAVDSLIVSLDAMQQIDISRPSLKQIEGNMGMSIVETTIPFDLDRKLTPEERKETEFYCRHDVEATIEVFKHRKNDYFAVKEEILTMLHEKDPKLDIRNAARWNTTTIVANILGDKNMETWTSLGTVGGYASPTWTAVWRSIEDIPEDVWSLWEIANSEKKPKAQPLKKYLYDCEFVFGFGGLHGVNTKRKTFKNVKLLDVASMYPSILINLNALGTHTKTYSQIKEERIKVKHSGDKLKSNALKLILNSTYGLLKNEHSLLNNPKASSTVCIYGQMAIFDLCRELNRAGYELVNINTDGVAFVDDPALGDAYKSIWSAWEQKFSMTLELDQFDYWVQKDVNNYIAVTGNHIKTKGGEVGKYNTEKLFSNNNARIINILLVECILQDYRLSIGEIDKTESVMRMLKNYRDDPDLYDPKLWMYVLKAGGTYKGVYDTITGQKQNNVNRVLAVKERYKNIDLVKKRMDGGVVRFPDMPESMMLWNEEISKASIEQSVFRQIIDLNHYAAIVEKKRKEWS